METLTHTSTTSRSRSRRTAQVLLAAMTALLMLLAAAPGADAQTRDRTDSNDTKVLAATQGCPDGFVEGRFGCVPENYTAERDPDYGVFVDPCPDNWVPSNAPGGCSPGFITLVVAEFDFDLESGCPDLWVPSSAPGGCSPGFLTMKRAGVEFDNGCPDNWVPSSAPGGCSPGFFTLDTGRQIFEAQHHCAFGALCDDMVEAIKALGGECVSSNLGETCTLPTGPPTRD